MDVRAAVTHKAGAPISLETVQLEGPRSGEVLVEIKATGSCHTDEFTLSGADPEGLFPSILGHEGAGIVVDVGKGVSSLAKGDHVIPLYTPECRQCPSCLSRKTNLCTAIRGTQGQGLMPDGTSRFPVGKEKVFHYMCCSTFSNVTVMRQALESAHGGWGQSIVVGVAGAGQEISTRPFQLVTGRVWKGTAFGGARGRTDVPKIVDWYMAGKIEIDPMITHTLSLDEINKGFDLMHEGKSIRSVVLF